MSIEVKLPDLGDGIDSADILNVLVAEGDTVEKDQDIVEIETDKATAEVPSFARRHRDENPCAGGATPWRWARR